MDVWRSLTPAQVFFHKYFSRKNCRHLAQVGQDEGSEGVVGSEGSQASGDEESADSEPETDEEGSSDVEEDVVWKVRTLRALGFPLLCALSGYAGYHAM